MDSCPGVVVLFAVLALFAGLLVLGLVHYSPFSALPTLAISSQRLSEPRGGALMTALNTIKSHSIVGTPEHYLGATAVPQKCRYYTPFFAGFSSPSFHPAIGRLPCFRTFCHSSCVPHKSTSTCESSQSQGWLDGSGKTQPNLHRRCSGGKAESPRRGRQSLERPDQGRREQDFRSVRAGRGGRGGGRASGLEGTQGWW